MPALFTIGYENARIDDVIAALRQAGALLLLDIREAPISRKPGFSKRQLAAHLDEAGIAYLHLRALGTPKEGRVAARCGDAAAFHAIYERHFAGEGAQAALAEAARLAAERPACLLCFERDEQDCHRLIVSDALGRQGFRVHHLRPIPSLP